MNKEREALKELFETIEESLTDEELVTIMADLWQGTAVQLVQNVNDDRTVFVTMHIKKASVV